MVVDKLPPHLEHELSMLGVKPLTVQPVKQPVRTYEFRRPKFDENGEPDF